MPYISQEDRDQIAMPLENLLDRLKAVPDDKIDGVLNYTISRIVSGTLGDKGWRYRLIARAIAVFEAAKLEFYRRIASSYEDLAIGKNGDIPEYPGA